VRKLRLNASIACSRNIRRVQDTNVASHIEIGL